MKQSILDTAKNLMGKTKRKAFLREDDGPAFSVL
jgi:hypothetical protein